MRGKPKRLMVDSFGDRITPADAGKTCIGICFCACKRDHPRGCGENSKTYVDVRGTVGSPPRMRGKPSKSYSLPSEPGITPADAGKTIRAKLIFCAMGDHPRGCGENFVAESNNDKAKGSPPRMRGKH